MALHICFSKTLRADFSLLLAFYELTSLCVFKSPWIFFLDVALVVLLIKNQLWEFLTFVFVSSCWKEKTCLPDPKFNHHLVEIPTTLKRTSLSNWGVGGSGFFATAPKIPFWKPPGVPTEPDVSCSSIGSFFSSHQSKIVKQQFT